MVPLLCMSWIFTKWITHVDFQLGPMAKVSSASSSILWVWTRPQAWLLRPARTVSTTNLTRETARNRRLTDRWTKDNRNCIFEKEKNLIFILMQKQRNLWPPWKHQWKETIVSTSFQVFLFEYWACKKLCNIKQELIFLFIRFDWSAKWKSLLHNYEKNCDYIVKNIPNCKIM